MHHEAAAAELVEEALAPAVLAVALEADRVALEAAVAPAAVALPFVGEDGGGGGGEDGREGRMESFMMKVGGLLF